MRGCVEAERDRVADVQVPHRPAARFDLTRLSDDVADRVGEPANPGRHADRGVRRHMEILALSADNRTEEARIRWPDSRQSSASFSPFSESPRAGLMLSRLGLAPGSASSKAT